MKAVGCFQPLPIDDPQSLRGRAACGPLLAGDRRALSRRTRGLCYNVSAFFMISIFVEND